MLMLYYKKGNQKNHLTIIPEVDVDRLNAYRGSRRWLLLTDNDLKALCHLLSLFVSMTNMSGQIALRQICAATVWNATDEYSTAWTLFNSLNRIATTSA